ncbi:ATP-binding protein [Myroides fluvii]|uniref:ATP-binding protein n=1 Tax=Myroides fluvii TaxID=2572594 RepID=UPI00131E66AA|nr:tetratricopeptide repeat-containing sensor histidine kinase [Myroides fluvii]
MRHQVLVYSLVLLAVFSFTHCTNKQLTSPTDIDQLYAVQYDNTHKDSLAKSLAHSVANALTLSNTQHNRSVIDSTLNQLRWTLDSVNFQQLAQKSISFSLRKNDLPHLARTYNHMGMYYHDSYQLDSTFYYYIKTENIYKKLNDSLKIGETKFYQARLLFEMGLHMESESKVSQALSILNQYPQNPVNFEANQLMGLCLMERKNYKEAETYLITAVHQIQQDITKHKVLDTKRAKMAIGNAYGNLAEVCYSQNKFIEAKAYALRGQAYLEEDTPIMLVSFLRNTLAQCNYRLTKDSRFIQEVHQSFIDDSILGNSFRMYYSAMNLAHLYLLEQQPQQANTWAQLAYTNATKHQVLPQQVEALEFLLTHDDYQMHDKVKELIRLRQALTTQENQTRNTFARIAYQTEVIEKENNQLKDRIYTVVIFGIILLFILIISIFRSELKIKNKELQLVKAQRKANKSINELIVERNLISLDIKKKERNRIAKNLHDSIVNTLFGVRFHLELLDTPQTESKQLLIQELKKLENTTRDISHTLIDNRLFNEHQFEQVVTDLVSFQINAWKTRFSLEFDSRINFEKLDATTKINLYYILQEAIQNVNKYSKATLCTIVFHYTASTFNLIICDNGIGFEKTEGMGMGVSNMHERSQQINATLHLHSKQGEGVMLTVAVPH